MAEPAVQNMGATPSSSSQGPTPRTKPGERRAVPALLANDTNGVSGTAKGSMGNGQKPLAAEALAKRHSAGGAGSHSKPSRGPVARRHRGSAVRQRRFDQKHEDIMAKPMNSDPDAPHKETGATEDGVVRFTVDFCGMGATGFPDGSDDGQPEEEEDKSSQGLLPQPAPVQPRNAVFTRGSRAPPPLPHSRQEPPCPQARAFSQPPPLRSPLGRGSADAAAVDQGSPAAGSNCSDPSAARLPKRAPWKQKPIEVPSTDYYLDILKAARGGNDDGGPVKPCEPSLAGDCGTARRCEGGYGKRLRQRATDVEVAQRKQEEDRLERGMATLERAQRRALQAGHSRSASCDV